jgi:flavin-dependent dehydrogenase
MTMTWSLPQRTQRPICAGKARAALEYDVIIVGARVAGASLALLLGERGHRVLMVDRDRFPSDTLSTHFMSFLAVPLLARLGVLADVEAAGFRRLTRTRVYVGDCMLEGPNAPAGGYGLAPRRDCLDAVLIEHAVRRGGVDFWPETRAEGLILDSDRVVGVRVQAVADDEREVRAAVVVGADGKYSKVAAWVGATAYNELPPLRPAYYGYYHGMEPLPEPALELFYAHEQIGFIFPMQPGVDCLALEIQPEDFEEFRSDPRAAFEGRFRALPGMARRLAGTTLEGKLQGTRGIANYFRTPYGPGWALTGDAGYLKDPSSGLGIGDAISQSFLLADALDAALRGADWDASLGAFQRKRDKIMLPAYQSTIGYTRMRDASAETLGWLRAVLSAPFFARMLVGGLPNGAPQIFPESIMPGIQKLAEAFAAEAAEVPVRAAP